MGAVGCTDNPKYTHINPKEKYEAMETAKEGDKRCKTILICMRSRSLPSTTEQKLSYAMTVSERRSVIMKIGKERNLAQRMRMERRASLTFVVFAENELLSTDGAVQLGVSPITISIYLSDEREQNE